MSKKIIGITVGTTLPKPNFKQTDPTKGDYIRNKPDFDGLKSRVSDVEERLNSVNGEVDPTLSIEGKAADAKVTGDAIAAVNALVGDEPVATQITQAIEANKVDLTGYATETYVATKVAGLVDSAPETLNTLNELSAALGDDPNFATTVATQIGTKVPTTRTINGKALSDNIVLSASDLGIEAITDAEIDAICSDTIEVDNPLVDDATGKNYTLYVSNGELKMTEVD